MHPLKAAYLEAGLTQADLAKKVNKLRRKRANGVPLRVTAGFISQLCTGYRICGIQLARAFADVLKRPGLENAIVFGESRSAA